MEGYTLLIPKRENAQTRKVPIKFKVGKNDHEFEFELPRDVASAIAILGELEVRNLVVKALVSKARSDERNRLLSDGATVSRSGYLNELDKEGVDDAE